MHSQESVYVRKLILWWKLTDIRHVSLSQKVWKAIITTISHHSLVVTLTPYFIISTMHLQKQGTRSETPSKACKDSAFTCNSSELFSLTGGNKKNLLSCWQHLWHAVPRIHLPLNKKLRKRRISQEDRQKARENQPNVSNLSQRCVLKSDN